MKEILNLKINSDKRYKQFIDICDLPEDIFPPNIPAIEDYINKNKT